MKLKDILNGCLFADGDWIESKDQDPNGEIRLIQLADIGDGFFINKSSKYINSDTAKRLKCTFLEKNDVLVARMPDPLGRACIFPLDERNKYITAVDVCIIRTKENCHSKYLQYCLNSKNVRNSIERQKTGTTRERITRKKLGDIDIPLPPLEQQKKIASILDAADTYRQKTKALIAKYDELTQSLFLEMFGDPVKNEKGFRTILGNEIFVYSSGKFNPTKNLSPFFEYATYGGNGVTGYSKDYMIDFQTIIIGRVGAYCGSVHLSTGKIWVTDNAIYIKEIKKALNLIYAYYFFENYNLNRFADYSGQPKITQKPLESLKFVYPESSLQNQFSERVQANEEQKAQAQASLEKAEKLFNSLLQRAFKGELV